MDKNILVVNDNKIDVNEFYSSSIAKNKYPLTKGLPFCCANIQHCIEIFNKEKQQNNYTECSECKLKRYCPYQGKGFKVSPITNPNPDLIDWLENENTTIRL